MKAFRDYSGMQGWKQFVTDRGEEIRAEHRGSGSWSIYKREGNSFIHYMRVSCAPRPTSRQIWNAAERVSEITE